MDVLCDLIRRDAGVADDLAVAGVVGCDLGGEMLAVEKLKIIAKRRGLFLHLRHLVDRGNLAADAFDYIARHLRRSRDAEPDADVKTRHAALVERRHVGQDGDARERADGERLYLAGLDILHDDIWRRPDQWNLPAEQIVERRRGALVRHVRNVDAG